MAENKKNETKIKNLTYRKENEVNEEKQSKNCNKKKDLSFRNIKIKIILSNFALCKSQILGRINGENKKRKGTNV